MVANQRNKVVPIPRFKEGRSGWAESSCSLHTTQNVFDSPKPHMTNTDVKKGTKLNILTPFQKSSLSGTEVFRKWNV